MKVTSDGFTGGWYSDSNLDNQIVAGAEYSHNNPVAGESKDYYIKATFASTEYGKIKVTVKTPPDILYWTGSIDSNWNNPANWSVNSTAEDNPKGFLPALCTEIQLPGNSNFYPSLTDSAGCGLIDFKHGAVLGRQDLLHYDSAKIELKLNANQWYMFSPPLRNMYTGDFYVDYPNPYEDGYFIEPMLFSMENPQTGTQNATGIWTGRFNNPDYELQTGRGIAVWVDEDGTGYGDHSPATFRFPKSDPFYYLYAYGMPIERTSDLIRDFKGRFIYESSIDANGIVTWTIPEVSIGEAILIGNPFLASLNFEAFADLNSGDIESGYKLAYGLGADGLISDFFPYWKGLDGAYAGESGLNAYIPPMQSFIVVSKRAGSLTLKADIRETSAGETEKKLRSAQERLSERSLWIIADREQAVSKALLLHRAGASGNYLPSEDSYKLFTNDSTSVRVYTRSSDGYALDINSFGDPGERIPVGVRTNLPGEIRLQFSGMESFGDGTAIYLHDKRTGESIDLSETDEYVFEKVDNELYLENRFFLTFAGQTGIQPAGAAQSNIVIRRLPDRTLRIASDNGSPLGRIQMTGIQGKVMVSREVKESSYTFRAPTTGVYIIHVSNRAGIHTRKLIIN
jgi:hypothetical protein